jgi:hypothetical protein
MAKPKIATTSLAGCFGCHMSVLDIDDRILQLVDLVDFDKSPIDDKKTFDGRVDGRADRRGMLQRGERQACSRIFASIATFSSRSATAPSWAGFPRCATESRSGVL